MLLAAGMFILLRLIPILAKEKNVTRAAQKANLSQSAFSHALNRLREQLKDEMFIRTHSGMEPTPYAARMIPVGTVAKFSWM